MGVTSTTGTLAANVANGRLRTVRPGSSFPVADLAPVTMEGRGGKQERGRMEEIKGSSLVGETTTVAAAVITIITTATTMDNNNGQYNNGNYNNGHYNNGHYNNGNYNNGNYNNGFSSGFTNGGGCQCDNRLSFRDQYGNTHGAFQRTDNTGR